MALRFMNMGKVYALGFALSLSLHIALFALLAHSSQATMQPPAEQIVPMNFVVLPAQAKAELPTKQTQATKEPQLSSPTETVESQALNSSNETIIEPQPSKPIAKKPSVDKLSETKQAPSKKPSSNLPATFSPKKTVVNKQATSEGPIKKAIVKDKPKKNDPGLDALIAQLESAPPKTPVTKPKQQTPPKSAPPQQIAQSQPTSVAKQQVSKINNDPKLEQSIKRRLQELIAKNKHYPARARRNGDEGLVKVSFAINPNGNITNITVIESSGYRSLDQAAITVLKKSSGQLTFPKQLSEKQRHWTLPIEYRLN